MSTGAKRKAEVHGALAKNARGDLPAILLTPDEDPTYGEIEPQSLAMTRSIGDFYMQTFGARPSHACASRAALAMERPCARP